MATKTGCRICRILIKLLGGGGNTTSYLSWSISLSHKQKYKGLNHIIHEYLNETFSYQQIQVLKYQLSSIILRTYFTDKFIISIIVLIVYIVE